MRWRRTWLSVCRLLCSSLSFQPFNFVASPKSCEGPRELLCDAWAVRNSTNAYVLARCLRARRRMGEAHLCIGTRRWRQSRNASSLTDRVRSRLIGGSSIEDAWNTDAHRRRMFTGGGIGVAFAFRLFRASDGRHRRTERAACRARRFAISRSQRHLPATLSEHIDLLEKEVGRLKSEMVQIDKVLDGTGGAELRNRAGRLRATTDLFLKHERRLVELCPDSKCVGDRRRPLQNKMTQHIFGKDSRMIRTIPLSLAFIALAYWRRASSVTQDQDPSFGKDGSRAAAPDEDELQREIDQMRSDVRELRREVHTSPGLLQSRTDGYTPAERAMFADLVEQYNKLVKADRWAEAELVARASQGSGPASRRGHVGASGRGDHVREGPHRTASRPECRSKSSRTATALKYADHGTRRGDAAFQAQDHLFPNGRVHGQVENELELLKLRASRRTGPGVRCSEKQGGSRQFVAACRRIIETVPNSSYAKLARDEMRQAADERQPAGPAPAASGPSAAERSILRGAEKTCHGRDDQCAARSVRVLQKQGGFNIVIDKAGLDEVGNELKITISISAEGVGLAGALKRVLGQLGLDYSVSNDVLLISSPLRTAWKYGDTFLSGCRPCHRRQIQRRDKGRFRAVDEADSGNG